MGSFERVFSGAVKGRGAGVEGSVLAFLLFNSENLPSDADAGYGAFAETQVLKRLFEAWQPLSQRPIAEIELRACHGDLFEEHILGDDACTLYVLGRMMHRPGVDATLLPTHFCEAMRTRQRVGFIPWAVGLCPVPVPVLRHVHAELSRESSDFYIGAVQFPSSQDFAEMAARLQLPQTLGIRGGKCFGDWLGRPSRLTHTQDGPSPAAAAQEPTERAADGDVTKKAFPIARREDVAATFRTPRSGIGVEGAAFGTPLADTGLEFQLRRLAHAHREMVRAKRRAEGRDLRTRSVMVLSFMGACALAMFMLAAGVIAIYGEDPKDAPFVWLLTVYLVPIAIGVFTARRTRQRRAAKARAFLVEAENRLAREVHSFAVSHPNVVQHVLGDKSRLLEKESVDELVDILLTRRQILCAGETLAGNSSPRPADESMSVVDGQVLPQRYARQEPTPQPAEGGITGYVCDICGKPVAQTDMRVVSPGVVVEATRRAYVPSKMPMQEFISQEERTLAWRETVGRNATMDWGLCQACHKELTAHRGS